MKQYHPDVGGDTATCQQINADLERWLSDGMGSAFREYERTTGRGFDEDRPYVFADILARIVRMHGVGTIEVIGYWVYAFDSYEAREALKALGFFFSGKHKAWIYSGQKRKPVKGHYTTEQLRAHWGSEEIAKQEEVGAIPA